MPRQTESGRRYAQAVFDLAGKNGDKWQADLNDIVAATENADLAALVDNPRVPAQAKRDALQLALPGLSEQALNLATILATKNRLKALAKPVAVAFTELLDAARGIAGIEIVTAVPMDRAQQERIGTNLSQATGLQVRMTFRVNPAIQGGMVVRVGDRVLDGSVRSKLESLKHTLVG